MDSAEILADGFERISGSVHAAVEGMSASELAERPDKAANSVAWLVWHLARVQDDHVADAAGTEQVWHSAGWVDTFDLALPRDDTGYGHSAKEVAAVRVDSADVLLGYFDAVHAATLGYVRGLKDTDLDRVVDEGWDPPVTLGVRLVSVLADDLQHVGQAAYVHGLVRRG